MAKLKGRQALKRLVLEVSGWILVVAGIAALVLPGRACWASSPGCSCSRSSTPGPSAAWNR